MQKYFFGCDVNILSPIKPSDYIAVKPTSCEDGESGLQHAVTQILSGVLWLQVLDQQSVVSEAEPAPLCYHRTVSEPSEDGLPPSSLPLLRPPLLEFGGVAAGEQQRPACRHHEVMS